jgi:hypothetical protein
VNIAGRHKCTNFDSNISIRPPQPSTASIPPTSPAATPHQLAVEAGAGALDQQLALLRVALPLQADGQRLHLVNGQLAGGAVGADDGLCVEGGGKAGEGGEGEGGNRGKGGEGPQSVNACCRMIHSGTRVQHGRTLMGHVTHSVAACTAHTHLLHRQHTPCCLRCWLLQLAVTAANSCCQAHPPPCPVAPGHLLAPGQ